MNYGKLIALLLAGLISIVLAKFLPLDLSWIEAAGLICTPLFLYAILVNIVASVNQQHNKPANPTHFKGARRLAASLREAVILVNDRHQIEYINPAAYMLFPNIRTGTAITGLFNSPQLNTLVTLSLFGEKPDPFIYQLFDPVERHIRVTASPLKTTPDDTENSRAIIVFYDVTDLERANALRADFLANASHELKTPVASLLGYIETLNGHAKDDPEARTKFLGIMQQQAQRMQRLISDILSLRRIELTEHKAPTETADLYLAYLAAYEAVTPMADRKNIKAIYTGPKELLVTGQQDELVQLVLNIIDNAVKMNPSDSQLKIVGELIENWQPERAFPKNDLSSGSARRRIVDPPQTGIAYAQLRIRDQGPGFSRDHLPRLSERFYRIAGDRNSQEKGTGLGLAIVKHIAMRHRGGLMIETAENTGTEFTILIPAPSHKPNAQLPKVDDKIFLNFKNMS